MLFASADLEALSKEFASSVILDNYSDGDYSTSRGILSALSALRTISQRSPIDSMFTVLTS